MNSSVMVTAGANQASPETDDFMSHLCCFNKPVLMAFPPRTSQPSYGEKGNCGWTTWTLSRVTNSGGDVTISRLPLDNSRASDFRLMKIDSTGRVIPFSEKPKGDDLKAMGGDTSVLSLSSEETVKKPHIEPC